MHIELPECAMGNYSCELFRMLGDEEQKRYRQYVHLYDWLDHWGPGQFILISTGGWSFCPWYDEKGHEECHSFKPMYRLYLCPMKGWQEQEDYSRVRAGAHQRGICKVYPIEEEYDG